VTASIHLRTTALQGVSGVSAAVRGKVAPGDMAPGVASLASRAEKVAAIAAEHAAAVDRDSRFPAEAIAAARAERLMGIAVPRELGGEGASIGDVVDVCYTLGRACAATAMVYAMHQTKVACIARHGSGSAWHRMLLRRLCKEQMLLASSTTEGQSGGDVRNSAAPIERQDSRIELERQATVISFAAYPHCRRAAPF
jgi:acyl-CoA dehydrogenase